MMYEKLKEIRRLHSVNGEELAIVLGLTKATYSKKENGTVKFSLNEAKKIADYFNMGIEELFFDYEVSKIETSNCN